MTTERFSCAACAKWFEFEADDDEHIGATIACPFCDLGHAERAPADVTLATGTYKFSRSLKRMIKISDDIPRHCGANCGGCTGGSCSGCGSH